MDWIGVLVQVGIGATYVVFAVVVWLWAKEARKKKGSKDADRDQS